MSTIQLLPAVASDILKGNAATLGRLLGAAGAGALVGIVFVMPFVERIKRPCMAIGGALMWSGVWYILFSRSNNFYLTLACQFMTSLGAANVVTLSIGLSQELTPPGMRARIVSTFLMIIFGLQPVASWLIGTGAHKWGLQPMILVNGILMVLVPAILLTLPRLNQLRRPDNASKGHDRCVGF
ncbi:MFS transporter [Puia sp. P3]|uniref:MFS transporter n=1 Tax=Puia sp. P3 TaxID=3423952 RepID=UPI003D667692